ncbi:hypothetical protein PR048_024027 [Dryococelus australis]|uniref:Uncharacterized protein n=1 Tax=Dryococelus australis TaxID=614101 RepID=A0ABQ9GVQ4_9NEOP|nr:hypothetical protein PR048_024027 [Dryococelus australis]
MNLTEDLHQRRGRMMSEERCWTSGSVAGNTSLSELFYNLATSSTVMATCVKLHSSNKIGATLAVRLDCSPPTKANRVESPASSLRILASGNRAGRCGWSAGFLGDLPFPPPLHSGAAPCLTSPSSALKTSLLKATQISSLTRSNDIFNIFVHIYALYIQKGKGVSEEIREALNRRT